MIACLRRGAAVGLLAAATLLAAPFAAASQAAEASSGVTASLEEARRLTWERESRPAGIAALRRLASENPERMDVAEALAEVLTWSRETRPEAIDLLREILDRDPGRLSTSLILAEVLSWRKETRAESYGIYSELLEEDAGLVDARVGLARLHSWRGDLSEAEALYREALHDAPGNVEARLGLAEVQRWSGKPQASLETLAGLPPDERETPDARRQRAGTLTDLHRPALALAEYEAVLTADPGDDETRQAAEKLRRRLRPRLEVGLTGSTESGEPATSRLEYLVLPATWNAHTGHDLEYRIRADAGTFHNSPGSTRRLSAGGGVSTPLGDRFHLDADLDLRWFDLSGTEVTGRVELRYAPLDRLKLRFGADRDLVYDSRLSAAGEEIGGVLYGPVLQNELYLGISGRPGRAWDLWLRAAAGPSQGTNVVDNDRQTVFAGFGRSIRRGSLWLKPGFLFAWMSYDKNLSGFPPADLGGDGITSPGVGGYFSPYRFMNNMVRLDSSWPVGRWVEMSAGGAVGRQQAREFRDGNTDSRTSSEAYIRTTWEMGPVYTLRGEITYLNVAAAFRRTRVGIYLIRLF
jgi:tetratricopeptide (TPR) repeat protein